MITRRRILTKINEGAEGDFVDFGFRSGVKWAKGNIVKDTDGNYSIGNETDYGCHFSWGNIKGHNDGDGYDFGDDNNGPYANTSGALVTDDIENTDAQHDAALACLGSPWHLPTLDDFQELYDNTDQEWTTIDGINGLKFMKKTDPSVYVFFPAAGMGDGTSIKFVGMYGYYWSSSYYNTKSAYNMDFSESYAGPQNHDLRSAGYSVRAVHE